MRRLLVIILIMYTGNLFAQKTYPSLRDAAKAQQNSLSNHDVNTICPYIKVKKTGKWEYLIRYTDEDNARQNIDKQVTKAVEEHRRKMDIIRKYNKSLNDMYHELLKKKAEDNVDELRDRLNKTYKFMKENIAKDGKEIERMYRSLKKSSLDEVRNSGILMEKILNLFNADFNKMKMIKKKQSDGESPLR